MAALYDSVVLVLLILVFIGFVWLQKEEPAPPIIRDRTLRQEGFQSGDSGTPSVSVRSTEVAAANATICNLQPQFDRLQCAAYITANGPRPPALSGGNSLTGYTGAGNYTTSSTGGSALTLPSVSITGSINNLQTIVSISGADPTPFVNTNDMLYFGYIIDVQGPYVVASVSSTSITLSKKYVGPNLMGAILSIVPGNTSQFVQLLEQSSGSSSSPPPITGTLSAGTSYVSINNTNLPDGLSIGDLIYINGPCNEYDRDDPIYPSTICISHECNANEVDLLNNTCQIYNCVSPADTYNNNGTCTSATQYMPCLNDGVFDPVSKQCITSIAPDSYTSLQSAMYMFGLWTPPGTIIPTSLFMDDVMRDVNIDQTFYAEQPAIKRYKEAIKSGDFSYTPGVKAQPYVYNVITHGVKGAIVSKSNRYPSPYHVYPKRIGPFYLASNPSVGKLMIRSKSPGDLDANGKFSTVSSASLAGLPDLASVYGSIANKIPLKGRDNIVIEKLRYASTTTSGTSGTKTSLTKEIIGCSPGTYGSSCTKCYPGQTTTTVGSRYCVNCGVNTTSVAGGQCTPCGANLYASPGDPICSPCTTQVIGGICDSPGYVVGSSGFARGINMYESLSNSAAAAARLDSLVRRLPAGFPAPNIFQYISFATSNSIVVSPNWVAFVYLWDNTYSPAVQATFNRLKLDLSQYTGTTTVPTNTFYILLFKQSEVTYTNGEPRIVTSGRVTPLPLAICPSGYCCDGGKYSTYDSDVCTPCESGTVSAYGASVCVSKCPANQQITPNGCVNCPANKSSVSGESCANCPNNHTSIPGGGCGPCQNNYTSIAGLACVACGNNRESIGGLPCTPCPAGKTSVGGTGCVNCAAGKTSVSGQACTSCPPGKYSAAPGSPSCTVCPAGKFSAAGAVSCTNCSPGYYSLENATTCTPCAAGEGSGDGASSCTDCSPNYFSAGGEPCMPCMTNTYNSTSKSRFCKPCYAETSAFANIGYRIDGIAFDSNNNTYVSDSTHRIRMITPAGVVSIIAGTGTAGHQDGAGASAMFRFPKGLAIDANNNIYVADQGNNVIRKILASTWVVSTIAGTVRTVGNEDGIPGKLSAPSGIAINKKTNTIYVSDVLNHNIRAISSDGTLSTLAGYNPPGMYGGYANGLGQAAQFKSPMGITIDSTGNLFVADQQNNVIRKITPSGDVSLYAGKYWSNTAPGGPYNVIPGTISWGGQQPQNINQSDIRVLGAGAGPSITDPNLQDTEFNRSVTNSVTMINTRTQNIGILYCMNSGPIVIMILKNGSVSQARTYVTGNNGMDSYTDAYWNNGTIVENQYTLNLTDDWINFINGGKDGPRLDSVFRFPRDITIDAHDILYVSDSAYHKIRMITPSGNVTTLAGNGQSSTASPTGSVNGLLTTSILRSPSVLAIDSNRRIVFTEGTSTNVRQISTTQCTAQIKAQY